jgi:tetratricopeptide (TPR) repeat protein
MAIKDVIAEARSAMAKEDWETAIILWGRCLAERPQQRVWRRAMARSLEAIGNFDDAENIYRHLSDEDPSDFNSQKGMIRSSVRKLQLNNDAAAVREEILKRLDSEAFSGPGERPALRKLQTLNMIGEIDLARQFVPECLASLDSIDGCDRCHRLIPPLAEDEYGKTFLDRLLVRALSLADSAAPAGLALHLRLLLTLGRMADFIAGFDKTGPHLSIQDNAKLAPIFKRLNSPQEKVFSEQKVFVIGLSKTATTSLSHAMTILGIDNGHWQNPVTHRLLSDIDYFMLGGASDIPVANNFERLFRTYPNAKFIYTVRPIESWLRSITAHYAKAKPDYRSPRCSWRHGRPNEELQAAVYLNYSSFEDAYAAHDKRVRSFFSSAPAGKLLEFNPWEGHGWNELCSFLDAPLPDVSFPMANVSLVK